MTKQKTSSPHHGTLFVVDQSSSMQSAYSTVKAAVRYMLDHADTDPSVNLVHYNSNVP